MVPNLSPYLTGSGHWKTLNDKLRNSDYCSFVHSFLYSKFNEHLLDARYFPQKVTCQTFHLTLKLSTTAQKGK